MNRLFKATTTIWLFILLSINGFAQEWIPLKSQKPMAPKVTLLAESEKGTTVQFSLAGFFKDGINTPKGMEYLVSVPKMASILQEGAPDLPLFAIPILIDDLAEMEIMVDDIDYQDFEAISIIPSKGNLSRKINPDEVPFRYGEVYSKDHFFPETLAQLDEPYIIRDCRGQNIIVYPFSYNPVSKTLRVFYNMTLTVHKTGDCGRNPKLKRKSNVLKISPEAEALYNHRFINYSKKTAKYPFLSDEGEMLVICPEAYLVAMQPLVDWKNLSGRPTTMVNLSEIGGNNDTQIKNYIQNLYNNPQHNLTYVLLVGDYSDITPHSMNGGASDIWFGQLEGNDYYPEVFVGRFSVRNVADVQNHVAKVLYYERDIPSSVTWLNHGIGIGSSEGAGSGHNGGESDYQHINFIRDTLMHYTYSTVSQHYQGVGVGTNAAMLKEDFNNGASICNYCNHGSTTGWYVGSFNNSHVNALTNDYKWPVVWSTACLNGQFNVDCFAEAWMRATNNSTGAPTGAIGGMFSWTNQPWQPPMTGQDEMVDILCEWRSADQFHHTLAGASLNGNMKILDLYPSDQGATHNTWILFGDPTLMLRTDNPSELNLIYQPEAIFLGQTQLLLTADAELATATLTYNGNVMATTEIVNGEGRLVFASPTSTGTAKLVVTAFNKVTEVHDIEIIPADGPFLTYQGFSVNDANGQADYGEACHLDLTLKNIGNEPASNVQVTLSTDSPWVAVTDATATIPSIGALSEYTIEDGFGIVVNEDITDGAQAEFTIVCNDASHSWTGRFRMTLHAPRFALVEFRPISTTFPGETSSLLVGIKNVGSSDAHNAKIQLFSSSTDLTLGQDIHSIGDIPVDSVTTISAIFSTSANVPIGSCFEIYYILDAAPYSFDGIETLNIGPLKETFETGDFSTFEWQSLGSAPWFIDNSTSNTGTYSACSGAISHANLTTLQLEINVIEDGQISFYKKTSTEANKDKLTFYIDNTAMGEWSGMVNWSRESFPVTAGTHKFKWIYMKDSNGSYGLDCCWIDDVQFPSSNVVSFIPSLELEAQVNLNEIVIQWRPFDDVDHYVVRRDGEIVATPNSTSYSEYQNIGTYTYSVTAVSNEGYLSIPAFVTLNVNTIGVNETLECTQLFPNPTSDLLNIRLEQPFQYKLFNALGQLITEGEGAGEAQLRCNNLPKGLYFLQITTESHSVLKKITIE